MEKTIQQNEFILKVSQEVARLGLFIFDLNMGAWTSSEVLDEIFGIDKNYARDIDGWLKLIHPEFRKEIRNYFVENSSAQHQSTDKEYRIISHDTRADKWVRIIAEFELDSQGNPATIIGTIQDITDRKRVEEALRETNEYLENLFKYANAPVIVWDTQFRITRFNPAFEALTGRNAKDVIGKSLEILFPPENVKHSMQLIRQAQEGEHWETVEILIQRVDGSIRTVLWNSATVLGIDRKTSIATIAQGQDITDRKKAELSLQQSEKRFRDLVENALVGVFLTNINGDILYVNETAMRIFKFDSSEDLISDGAVLRYKNPTDRKVFIENLKKTGKVANFEFDAFTKNGETISILMSASISGELISGMVLDITERKRTREALRETNEYLENLFHYANAPVIVWDPQFKITRFNPAFELLTGRNVKNVIGKSLEILFPPELVARSMKLIKKAQEGERWQTVEINILHVNGSVRVVLWNSASVLGIDRKTSIATIAQGQDITDRKSAEEQLKASLKEKEVLLREIHHRVKNNLQIISSLLSLQSEFIKNKTALRLFNESQNRIKSMALIHEELYKSASLTRIDFSKYIRNLTSYLFTAYGVNPDIITLKLFIRNVSLSIDATISCSLIINELVSNSLNHAFPNGKKGEISIHLHSDAGNIFTLIVSDNGIGFPEELDFTKTDTLGLQLVNMLIEELEGTIEIRKIGGTQIKIRFADKTIK